MIQEGERNYLDEYFKDRLFNYEQSAPYDVWNKIEDRIKKKKSIAFWTIMGSLAASIIIMISIGVGYYFGSKQTLISGNNHTKPVSIDLKKENAYNNVKIPALSKNNSISSKKTETKYNEPNESILKNSTSSNKQFNGVNIKDGSNTTTIAIVNLSEITSPKKIQTLNKVESRQALLVNNYERHNLYISDKNIDILLGLKFEEPQKPLAIVSKKTWSLGGNIAPLYSSWNIDNNKGHYTTDYVNSVEKPILAYSGGFNINFESNRWRFETGVYYSSENQNLDAVLNNFAVTNTKDIIVNDWPGKDPNLVLMEANSDPGYFIKNIAGNNVYFTVDNNSNNSSYVIIKTNSLIPVNNRDTGRILNSMQQKNNYIEIPIIAKYKIIDRKIDVFVSGGLSTNILLSSTEYIKLSNTTVNLGSPGTINKYNYSGIVGLEFEIPLVKRLSFRFEPRFNYAISSIDKNSNISIHPYSFGAFTGMSFHF